MALLQFVFDNSFFVFPLTQKQSDKKMARSLYPSTEKLLTPTVILILNHITIPDVNTQSYAPSWIAQRTFLQETVRETNRITKALTANDYPANFIHTGKKPPTL